MLSLSRWQTGPAIVVTLGLVSSAIAPLAISAPTHATPAPFTVAQQFPDSWRQVTIPAGTRLPVRYEGANKIVVLPTETTPLTLQTVRNVRSTSGALLIPAGSKVQGNLKPASGGSQFIADTLVWPDGTIRPLSASSNVVTTTQEIQPGVDTGSVLKGAAIGAGAAAVISLITGRKRLTLGKILAGAGVGSVAGLLLGKKRADVIVIDANKDLTLTLDAPLALN